MGSDRVKAFTEFFDAEFRRRLRTVKKHDCGNANRTRNNDNQQKSHARLGPSSRNRADALRAERPFGSFAKVFLFPDGHRGLQGVDAIARDFERNIAIADGGAGITRQQSGKPENRDGKY